jgi:hypothetical protein
MSIAGSHKITSVRLTAGQAAELDDLASFDGVAVAEEIREAIDLLIAERRNDPAFRERVRAFAERSSRVLASLEAGSESARVEPAADSAAGVAAELTT